ncbi:MAG: trimethylamine methyltransferase family protein [Thermoleophilia bacterium]|nr:trimethylamine methyltransferase family protein [Thermoleophilia bacterium]
MTTPSLTFLDREEEERIYESALELLATIGVVVRNQVALELFRDNGACVEGQKVFLDAGLVTRATESAPRQYLMAGRESEFDVWPGSGRSYAATATGTEGYLDLRSGEWRKATKADVAEWAVLVDGLPNIDIIASPFPADAPLRTREVHIAYQVSRHCRKPLYVQPYTTEALDYILRLAEIIAGERTR